MTETVPQGALLLDVSESREIAEGWQVLQGVMAALPVDSSPATLDGAWILEKAGRLKLNGWGDSTSTPCPPSRRAA